jgi:diguanylate cyclase (GGDEF)-like protein
MTKQLKELYQLIGKQINGTPREKGIFICWIGQPIYWIISLGCAAGLLISRFIEEVYNPLLWAGLVWGLIASLAWLAIALFGSRRQMSDAQENRFANFTILFFGLSGVASLLLVGPFNLVTGIVLTGCVLIGLLLFPATQITLVFALSMAAILAYAIVISLEGTLYRPLLAPLDYQPAQVWYDLMTILAAGLIIIKDAFTVAALTSTWRNREASTFSRSIRDPLTGIANRGHLMQTLTQQLAMPPRGRKSLAVVLVDVDFFKQINDRYGHATGDQALIHVAATLQGNLRDNDLLGRYGGEEFLMLLPGATLAQASNVAERCAEALRRDALAIPGSPGIKLTASFGVTSTATQSAVDAHTLIEEADRAMYTAKHQGRDRVVIYSRPL